MSVNLCGCMSVCVDVCVDVCVCRGRDECVCG